MVGGIRLCGGGKYKQKKKRRVNGISRYACPKTDSDRTAQSLLSPNIMAGCARFDNGSGDYDGVHTLLTDPGTRMTGLGTISIYAMTSSELNGFGHASLM
jgi:hypothetical protein